MAITLLGSMLSLQSGGASGTKVDNGDGTYHYTLPSGASTETHWAGPVRWEYTGQADFAWSPASYGTRTITSDNWVEPGDYGMGDIVGSTKVDSLGREWEAIEVDEPSIIAFENGYYALSDESEGSATHTDEELISSTEQAEWTPHTWTAGLCGGNRDFNLWNGESRNAFSSPPTARQNKVVALFTANGFRCSGVMIDADSVLTAAHCILDSNGATVQITDACTRGNSMSGAQCAAVDSLHPHSAFDPAASGTEFLRRDIAIINLTPGSSLGSANAMGLSRAKSGTIESHDVYKSAYPGAGASPLTCSTNSPAAVDTSVGSNGKSGYWDEGTAFRAKTSYYVVEIDGSSGESGSPGYYYPNGCCGGSNWVHGVYSGHLINSKKSDGTVNWRGSAFARVRPVRRWIMASM